MQDGVHVYSGWTFSSPPRKPYDVIERFRDVRNGVPVAGKRTDTHTRSRRYAIERRDELRRQGRPAYVTDADGRRVEVDRWL